MFVRKLEDILIELKKQKNRCKGLYVSNSLASTQSINNSPNLLKTNMLNQIEISCGKADNKKDYITKIQTVFQSFYKSIISTQESLLENLFLNRKIGHEKNHLNVFHKKASNGKNSNSHPCLECNVSGSMLTLTKNICTILERFNDLNVLRGSVSIISHIILSGSPRPSSKNGSLRIFYSPKEKSQTIDFLDKNNFFLLVSPEGESLNQIIKSQLKLTRSILHLVGLVLSSDFLSMPPGFEFKAKEMQKNHISDAYNSIYCLDKKCTDKVEDNSELIENTRSNHLDSYSHNLVMDILSTGNIKDDKRFLLILESTIKKLENLENEDFLKLSIQFALAKKYIQDIIYLKKKLC